MTIPYKANMKAGRYARIAFARVGDKKYIQLTMDRAKGILTLSGSGIQERELLRDGRSPEEYIRYALKEYGDTVHAQINQHLKHPENYNERRPDYSENPHLTKRLRYELGLEKEETKPWQD